VAAVRFYVLIGPAFAFADLAVAAATGQSFAQEGPHPWADFAYFSYIVLATVGIGDPESRRSAAESRRRAGGHRWSDLLGHRVGATCVHLRHYAWREATMKTREDPAGQSGPRAILGTGGEVGTASSTPSAPVHIAPWDAFAVGAAWLAAQPERPHAQEKHAKKMRIPMYYGESAGIRTQGPPAGAANGGDSAS
jgi:hypothetical protein